MAQTPTSRSNWLRRPDAVVFHSRAAHYSEFSNFHPSGFCDGEKWFPTVEAFFQHAKFAEWCPEHAECIRQAATPAGAKALGRALRLDAARGAAWEARKVGVMRRALRLKFTQKGELKALLLATADRPLVERPMHRPDEFWAAGAQGGGRNMLGVLLMELRADLSMAGAAPGARTTVPGAAQAAVISKRGPGF